MKILLRYLAYILIISAFFRVVPIFAAVIYGESSWSFVISFVVSIGLYSFGPVKMGKMQRI